MLVHEERGKDAAPRFRTAYGQKLRVGTKVEGKTMTKQSMKEECDINFIVEKYQKTGVVQHTREYEGQYGEFMSIDYHEAMNQVTAAQEMFMSIPSDIRARFHNDPGEFLAFVGDDANIEEMRELGLALPDVSNVQHVTEDGTPTSPTPSAPVAPAESSTPAPEGG